VQTGGLSQKWSELRAFNSQDEGSQRGGENRLDINGGVSDKIGARTDSPGERRKKKTSMKYGKRIAGGITWKNINSAHGKAPGRKRGKEGLV